ncbi:unnamed protein product [Dicrocoelium dendriticum]|nr:unnamed protein product [Dicrocoelium dendriticum]
MSMRIEPFIVQAYLNSYQAHLLPDLTKLRWPITRLADKPAGMRFTNGTVFRPPRSFEPVMSRGQKALFKRLLGVFADLMFANGLGDRFFLNAGTLLGSFRHHDIIPWDEDVDVLVDLRVRSRLHQLFRNMNSGYLYSGMYNRDKLFTRQIDPNRETEDLEFSRNTSSHPWLWPFLDIGYYVVNETHVYELALYGGKQPIWLRDMVFPLLFRPLGKQWFPTPFRALLFMNSTIPFTPMCHLSGYDHILEVLATNARCLCFDLRERYAFVRRRRSNHRLVFTDEQYWKSITFNLLVTEEQLIAYESAEATEATVIHSILVPAQTEEADLDAYDYSKNMA